MQRLADRGLRSKSVLVYTLPGHVLASSEFHFGVGRWIYMIAYNDEVIYVNISIFNIYGKERLYYLFS